MQQQKQHTLPLDTALLALSVLLFMFLVKYFHVSVLRCIAPVSVYLWLCNLVWTYLTQQYLGDDFNLARTHLDPVSQ